MGSTPASRRRNRLRTIYRSRHPQKQRSKTTPGTTRPRTRTTNRTPQTNRHRIASSCVALYIIVAIPGILMTTPAQAAPITGRCPKYEKEFKKYGLPPKTFSKLAWRESRCNPKSISAIRQSTGRPDIGLVQISGSWATLTRKTCRVKYQAIVKALTTLECQLKVAAILWNKGKGAGNWSLKPGHYE